MGRLLLLDTNLLLFYLVTQVDLRILDSFKRVSSFRRADLLPLTDLVAAFQGLMTTPHVLAEVSNFLNQAPPPWRDPLLRAFEIFIRSHQERFEPAAELVTFKEFRKLALADTALLSLSREFIVATLDYQLYSRIVAAGAQAIHFDHLRPSVARGRKGRLDA